MGAESWIEGTFLLGVAGPTCRAYALYHHPLLPLLPLSDGTEGPLWWLVFRDRDLDCNRDCELLSILCYGVTT